MQSNSQDNLLLAELDPRKGPLIQTQAVLNLIPILVVILHATLLISFPKSEATTIFEALFSDKASFAAVSASIFPHMSIWLAIQHKMTSFLWISADYFSHTLTGVWSFVLFNDAWSQKGHSASNTTVILA